MFILHLQETRFYLLKIYTLAALCGLGDMTLSLLHPILRSIASSGSPILLSYARHGDGFRLGVREEHPCFPWFWSLSSFSLSFFLLTCIYCCPESSHYSSIFKNSHSTVFVHRSIFSSIFDIKLTITYKSQVLVHQF